MFEAHVGQFPEHVVQQDERAVVAGERVGRIEPQHMVGGAGERPGAGADPERGDAPRRRTPHRIAHRGLVGRARGYQDVAGTRQRPQRSDGIAVLYCNGRHRPLADDHRVHELHRDMACMFGPRRRDAPHRCARREPPGGGERGAGEFRGQVAATPIEPRRWIPHQRSSPGCDRVGPGYGASGGTR